VLGGGVAAEADPPPSPTKDAATQVAKTAERARLT
jgi:hypothetical protein